MNSKSTALLCLALGLAGATAARAEYCAGPADEPAVCTVEAYGGLQGERTRAFDLDGTIQLELGQVLELELDAFDQNHRRFPKDRLRFDVDAADCRDLLKLERTDVGRFSLHLGQTRGECAIWFWLPGNLNFEWSLTLQIAPRGRSGYAAAEADFITQRLYLALLGRDPDPQGLRDTSAAIQRGDLDRRVDEILRSNEYRSRAREAHPAWLLEQLYVGILGRKPDDSAVRAFTPMLQRGQIGEVARELLRSDEFERLLAGR